MAAWDRPAINPCMKSQYAGDVVEDTGPGGLVRAKAPTPAQGGHVWPRYSQCSQARGTQSGEHTEGGVYGHMKCLCVHVTMCVHVFFVLRVR